MQYIDRTGKIITIEDIKGAEILRDSDITQIIKEAEDGDSDSYPDSSEVTLIYSYTGPDSDYIVNDVSSVIADVHYFSDGAESGNEWSGSAIMPGGYPAYYGITDGSITHSVSWYESGRISTNYWDVPNIVFRHDATNLAAGKIEGTGIFIKNLSTDRPAYATMCGTFGFKFGNNVNNYPQDGSPTSHTFSTGCYAPADSEVQLSPWKVFDDSENGIHMDPPSNVTGFNFKGIILLREDETLNSPVWNAVEIEYSSAGYDQQGFIVARNILPLAITSRGMDL